MMTEERENVLAKVDAVLECKELLDQPRALLLLRLCQWMLPLEPELIEKYWPMLLPSQKSLTSDTQADFNELRTALEESLPSSMKGFTAEMLAEIQNIMKLTEPEAAKRQLQDCESRLKKKLLLTGKGQVWMALMDAWLPLDRSYAIQLLKNVSGGLQESSIIKWNKKKSFSEGEWSLIANVVGIGKIERVVMRMLEDDQQVLVLPKQILPQVAEKMRSAMQQFATPINQVELFKSFKKYVRLLSLHASSSQADLIPELMEHLYSYIIKANWLDQSWMMRFNLIEALIGDGISLKSTGIDLFTNDFLERLASKTPPHLVHFLWAAWAGASSVAQDAPQKYLELMTHTGQDAHAEAWFLISLVKRGYGETAFEIAENSPNRQSLLPRLRRCWIITHPETAKARISPADVVGDPIGEFLAQGGVKERAAYLKSMTQDGKMSVPGAMWAGAGTEQEAEGLRGFWKTLTSGRKSNDEIVLEYVTRNPLYSSYCTDTKKEEQFAEALRVIGYGTYSYENVDSALLGALVVWGDQEPEQVHTVLRAMWNAIRPDDPILMVDWLRNAILTRCINVFSADEEVLTKDYIEWINQELVRKGRQWTIGKQVLTLRLPTATLLRFCVMAANTVGGVSPARRDRILVRGLEKYEADPLLVESAAQLYSADKPLLALQPPVSIKSNLLLSWQMGVVKNALPAILQELLVRHTAAAK